MSGGLIVEVNRPEVDALVVAVLQLLAKADAKGPEAYVALMLVASTVMLGLDELPSVETINLVLGRFYPVWDQLLSEHGQKGKSVH